MSSKDLHEVLNSRPSSEMDAKGLSDNNSEEKGGPPKQKINQLYLVAAAFGAIFIALSCLLRGIESSKPLPAKYCLSLSYLFYSILCLIWQRCRLGKNGFRWPWNRMQEHNNREKFDCKQFLMTMLGGISEFVVSVAVLMSLSACLGENINQGVVASILVVNVVIVSIGSYLLFNELLSVTQITGIIFVIVSVVLISLFGP